MPIAQMILATVFVFLVGACVGSFLNVVIWRLPARGHEVIYKEKRGKLTLSWPPSHCPVCDAPIIAYQNIPILSYLFLRGKCAQCRTPIAIRYPLVELALSLLWGGLFLAYFRAGLQGPIGWMDKGGGAPVDNVLTDWPLFVWHAIFASALLAASAIDIDLFIIPLSIPWFLVILGLAGSAALGPPLTPAYAIVPHLTLWGWVMAKPVLGGAVGLVLANVLLHFRVLPRSFPWEYEDADAEEKDGQAAGENKPKKSAGEKTAEAEKEEALPPPPRLTRFWPSVIASGLIVLLTAGLWYFGPRDVAGYVGLMGAILVFLIGVLPRDEGQIDVTDEVVDEISHPGVRTEILKEALFLAIPLACAAIAYALPWELPPEPWLMRLLGSLLGVLAGGGALWMIRVGGSYGFDKQAMGLGDIHLLAGIGAVIGAPLALLSIPLAAFAGLLWAIVRKIQGKPSVLQFGPWLSVGAILALVAGNLIITWYKQLMF